MYSALRPIYTDGLDLNLWVRPSILRSSHFLYYGIYKSINHSENASVYCIRHVADAQCKWALALKILRDRLLVGRS